VPTATGTRIWDAKISGNGGLGIDVGGDGPSPAPPNAPAIPQIVGIDPGLAQVAITGPAGDQFRVEIFGSDDCDPTGYGEGHTSLGLRAGTIAASGSMTVDVTVTEDLTTVAFVSALVSIGPQLSASTTSEFSLCVEPDLGNPTAIGGGPSPGRVRLLPNAPNPFNPRTTLRFELDRDAPVELEIYDARGRRVRSLVRGEMLPAGSHRITWRGCDDAGMPIASGVYRARLRVGSDTRYRSLTVVR